MKPAGQDEKISGHFRRLKDKQITLAAFIKKEGLHEIQGASPED